MQSRAAAGPGDESAGSPAQVDLPHSGLGVSSGYAESAEPANKPSGQSIWVELEPDMQHGICSKAPGKTADALSKHAGSGWFAHLSFSVSMTLTSIALMQSVGLLHITASISEHLNCSCRMFGQSLISQSWVVWLLLA